MLTICLQYMFELESSHFDSPSHLDLTSLPFYLYDSCAPFWGGGGGGGLLCLLMATAAAVMESPAATAVLIELLAAAAMELMAAVELALGEFALVGRSG
jgi:hypothetical protein